MSTTGQEPRRFESDLVLDYISERSARLLSNAAADEEISHDDALELHDIIGELIVEVRRLLRLLNAAAAVPVNEGRP